MPCYRASKAAADGTDQPGETVAKPPKARKTAKQAGAALQLPPDLAHIVKAEGPYAAEKGAVSAVKDEPSSAAPLPHLAGQTRAPPVAQPKLLAALAAQPKLQAAAVAPPAVASEPAHAAPGTFEDEDDYDAE